MLFVKQFIDTFPHVELVSYSEKCFQEKLSVGETIVHYCFIK